MSSDAEPSKHELVYYNARMALREGRPLESVKLWLVRNTLEDQTERVSVHDADFGSVTWAALGELGICQDGQRTDEEGAGVWPLALYNWVVRNRGRRGNPKQATPFKAFQVGQQQRFVSIGDVLSADEIKTVSLFRGRCLRARLALIGAGQLPNADLADRQVSARLLEYLLEQAQQTLATEGIRGRSVVDARLFDVRLQIAALAEREARMKAREEAREGKNLGLSKLSVELLKGLAPTTTLGADTASARILRACLRWSIADWMALSPERRLFVFDHARSFGGDSEALDRISLGILDALIDAGEGEEVEKWVGYRVSPEDVAGRALIWGGERGRRLLALDEASGFRERSVVALHRGVQHLERGELPEALRLVAFALKVAPESRRASEVQALSLRWLSYVAAQFEITDELLITLQQIVPRREYSILLEDLMWRAVFHADRRSFDRGLANQLGRGALERRLDLLKPLSRGNSGRFLNLLRRRLEASPGETLRFLGQMVDRLEREDAGVRASQIPTLRGIRELLAPLAADAENAGRRGRSAVALLDRCQGILEGASGVGEESTPRDRARSLNPSSEVFAGNIRLAPSDPLPWPFRIREVRAPSIFTQIHLTPVEWIEDTERVFGWTIGG